MEPFILKNKGKKIFGILHLPKTKKKAHLVVLCHGWSASHLGTWNAFFKKAAEEFAKKGFAAVRFDFRGSGNSDGVFEEQTVSSMLNDLHTIIEVVGKREGVDASRIALVGHSQGAYIALFHAIRDKRVKTLISWMGRFSDYKDYAGKMWVQEAKRRGYLPHFEGYTVRYNPYVKDALRYQSEKALRKLLIPLGLLYGEADGIVAPAEGEYTKRIARGRSEFKVLKELDHDFTGRAGIQDEVIKITAAWLKKWL